jgi:hypothetical protein
MPLWAWAGFIALILYYVYRLRRAWITGEVKYGPFIYKKESSPITFWLMVAIEISITAFLVIFFGMIVRNQMAL